MIAAQSPEQRRQARIAMYGEDVTIVPHPTAGQHSMGIFFAHFTCTWAGPNGERLAALLPAILTTEVRPYPWWIRWLMPRGYVVPVVDDDAMTAQLRKLVADAAKASKGKA